MAHLRRLIGLVGAFAMTASVVGGCNLQGEGSAQDACGASGPNNRVDRIVTVDGALLPVAIQGFRHAGTFAAAGQVVAVVFADPADVRLDVTLVNDVTSERFTFPTPTHDDWSEVNITGLVCIYAGGQPNFYMNVRSGPP